jgi:hypothetical protein
VDGDATHLPTTVPLWQIARLITTRIKPPPVMRAAAQCALRNETHRKQTARIQRTARRRSSAIPTF